MDNRITNLKNVFFEKFNNIPNDIFSSPGRIELLGNHTDHNNGKVLVSSINLDILSLTTKANDVCIVSLEYGIINVSLSDLSYKEEEEFTSVGLVKGVLFKLRELGYEIGGFNAVMDSTIPLGAGVSSSAAFELMIAEIENYYYNNDSIDRYVLAKIAQFSENAYYGKGCGMLDQTGISYGGVNYIDFCDVANPVISSLKVELPHYQFILVNTKGNHESLTSYYLSIKNDMKKVSNYFGKDVLREINYDDLKANKMDILANLGEMAYNRAQHFFEENIRVEAAYKALENNDEISFLENLHNSGLSSYYYLKNCYCVTEDEPLAKGLRFVRNIKNTYSRVHGGGFAGTLLFICKNSDVSSNVELLNKEFGKENVILVSLNKYGTRHIGEAND